MKGRTFWAVVPVMFSLFAGGLEGELLAQQPDPNEMMEAMQASMTPGEAHQRLNPMVGSFDVAMKMWMAPESEAVEGGGTGEHKWVLGGRFLAQTYQGSFMGMPFDGIGYMGYDNIQKKYVSTWIDSMGTGIMTGEGSYKQDGVFEFWAQYPDPVSGGMTKFREVLKIESDDTHTLTMFIVGADGQEFQNMEIRYTRKK